MKVSIFLHCLHLYRGLIWLQCRFSRFDKMTNWFYWVPSHLCFVWFVTPSQILWWGIVITFVCLSVCVYVSVCHFVNTIKGELSILMKFNQIVYNHNQKVKFKDGLCPLIFKTTAVKKTFKMMKIIHNKSDFHHIDVKVAQ